MAEAAMFYGMDYLFAAWISTSYTEFNNNGFSTYSVTKLCFSRNASYILLNFCKSI